MDLLKIKKFKKVDRKTYQIGECKLVKRTNEDLGFSSEYLRYGRENILGIEYCWEYWIRIDEIKVQSEEAFFRLMEALKLLACSRGYKTIRFADHIEPDVFKMMKAYGFVQEMVPGDDYNSYLYYQISEAAAEESEEGEKDDD